MFLDECISRRADRPVLLHAARPVYEHRRRRASPSTTASTSTRSSPLCSASGSTSSSSSSRIASAIANHSQRVVAPMIFEQVFHTIGPRVFPRAASQVMTDVNAAKAAVDGGSPRCACCSSSARGTRTRASRCRRSSTRSRSSPPNGQAPVAHVRAAERLARLHRCPPLAGDQSFALDPGNGTRGILAPGGDVWDLLPNYNWLQHAAGKAVVFETAPLTALTLSTWAPRARDLWVRSSVDDADLQVTISGGSPRRSGDVRAVRHAAREPLQSRARPRPTLWPAPSETQGDS